MSKNFLEEDENTGFSYTDGFRFGFGFFIANLLGLTLLGVLAAGVNYAMHSFR